VVESALNIEMSDRMTLKSKHLFSAQNFLKNMVWNRPSICYC